MNVNKLTDVTGQAPAVLPGKGLGMSRDVDNSVDNSEGFNHKRLKNN
ncbi:hypothetical protein KAW50_00760 [candidate division WOR-3 bacterium]|nr:hypothetical protein [candidate division WOR-3 bacterium]